MSIYNIALCDRVECALALGLPPYIEDVHELLAIARASQQSTCQTPTGCSSLHPCGVCLPVAYPTIRQQQESMQRQADVEARAGACFTRRHTAE